MSGRPVARTAGLLLLGWLVPGAGHFFLGLRARGAVFLGLVALSLGTGVWLQGPMPWTFQGSPLTVLASLGCLGAGLPYLVLRAGLGIEGDVHALGYDYGGAFVLTAGLMNLLLILDVWDRLHPRAEKSEAPETEDTE